MKLSFYEAFLDSRTCHPVILLEQTFRFVSVFFSIVSMHFLLSCTMMCVLPFVARQSGMSVMQRDVEIGLMSVHESDTIPEGA
jgi:hypothetical protein